MGKKNFAKEKMFETENWKRRENIETTIIIHLPTGA